MKCSNCLCGSHYVSTIQHGSRWRIQPLVTQGPPKGHWKAGSGVAVQLQVITTRGKHFPSTKTGRERSLRSGLPGMPRRKARPGAPHLFSEEQKNCTHGLVLPLSGAGGRYMASEKHVSSSFSSSILGGVIGRGFSTRGPQFSSKRACPPCPHQLKSLGRMAPFYPSEAEIR